MKYIFQRFALLLSLFFCSSCASLFHPPATEPTSPVQANAELLFFKGDFENALTRFQQIYQTSLTNENRNQALYGLACTQMMMARNHKQFTEAINSLQKWDTEKGNSPFLENRRLLFYALKHQEDFLKSQNQEQLLLEKKKNWLITHQRKKISQMAITLEALQKQLEELEAIDENFQEKRKSL